MLARHGITPDVVSATLEVVIHKHTRSKPPNGGKNSLPDR
jgi:hypothetical protein